MMTATEIEQACYGVSPQARVDILTKWQLLVMREGMRRAAEECKEPTNANNFNLCRAIVMTRILSAAEQLTEKDL